MKFWVICFTTFFLILGCSPHYLAGDDDMMHNQDDYQYVVAFGDIQYYTLSNSAISTYQKSIDWIVKLQENGVNVSCVLHTGDITNNHFESQFKLFERSTFDLANSVPYYSAIGDHDYKWDGYKILNRDSTFFSQYNMFPATLSHVVAEYESGRKENVVYQNTILGQRVDVICLEFGPRIEVVQWASDYVKSHPNHQFIILTHEYLEKGGGRKTENLKSKIRLRNTSITTPDELWDMLIRSNNNVLFILCGHVGGLYAVTFDLNDCGRKVPQIQHNIQGEAYRKDNWLMLYEFQTRSDSVRVSIINAKTGEFYNDTTCLFSFRGFRCPSKMNQLSSQKTKHRGQRVSKELVSAICKSIQE